MQVPTWINPMVWGAVVGAIGIMVVGFSQLGWARDQTMKRLVAEAHESGAIAALTPFCVANYMKQPNAAKRLRELQADTSAYAQRESIEKAGFATMPGNREPSSGVAAACEIALRRASLAQPQPSAWDKDNVITR